MSAIDGEITARQHGWARGLHADVWQEDSRNLPETTNNIARTVRDRRQHLLPKADAFQSEVCGAAVHVSTGVSAGSICTDKSREIAV